MDRKSILAMILIAAIIILWPFYMEMVSPPSSRKNIPAPIPGPSDTTFAAKSDSAPPSRSILPRQPERKTGQDNTERLWKNAPPARIAIQTKLYSAVLSNKSGGTITQWLVHKYRDSHGNPVSFVDSVANISLSISYHGNRVSLEDAIFESTIKDTAVVLNDTASFSLSFLLVFDGSRSIIRSFTFYPDRYDFDMSVQWQGFGDEISNNEYQLQWLTGLRPTEKNSVEDVTYFKTYAMMGDEKQEFDVSDQSGGEVSYTGTTRWIATRTKYFIVYMIPLDKDGQGCRMEGKAVLDQGRVSDKNYSVALNMKFESNRTDRFKVYAGPTEFTALNQYGEDLSAVLEWGWAIIRPLTKGILYSFNYLYSMIPNYGWVIIVFTLFVKILLYPLTHKSYVGMQKMKEVMPRQKEIQKKYKDNPARMQQEMMKLYKEIGYNPLSGCLPMLIQMPILFPIYHVFHETIDLRQAPFFGWIKDLSLPDTIATLHTGLPLIGDFNVNPLPIIMTALTFVQQKITPMTPIDSTDPAQKFNQKFMMYGMPVLFFFLFNNFPSGLVLYWTVFNALTMLQQYLMSKHMIK